MNTAYDDYLRTTQPSLFLEDLYVDPSVRNRGAGKALFRCVAGRSVGD